VTFTRANFDSSIKRGRGSFSPPLSRGRYYGQFENRPFLTIPRWSGKLSFRKKDGENASTEGDALMTQFSFLSNGNRERYLRLIAPIVDFFARFHIHPNILSLLGLLLSAVAAVLYGTGHFFWAAWAVVLAGTCDALDGQLARITGKTSRFGAFFDSTLDRFAEVFIFLGLAWYFSGGHLAFMVVGGETTGIRSPVAVLFIVLAIGGSFMVSYTRARAEGLGLECSVGFMQRPERMVLLIIGSLLASLPAVGLWLMKTCLFLLALLSNFTALQRMIHVRNLLIKEMKPGER